MPRTPPAASSCRPPGRWSTSACRPISAPTPGVEEGGEVTPFYDPMIAKLIAYAPTREQALAELAEACDAVEVFR